MNDKLFIRDETGELCEGPLGGSADKIKLLFVMKEPNGKKLNCFWMKNVFTGNKQAKSREATRYFNVLNIFSSYLLIHILRVILLGQRATIREEDEILKQIAFINLFPFFGEKSTEPGHGYSALMQKSVWVKAKNEKVKEKITVKNDYDKILRNRIEIIMNALESGAYVVAHYEIVKKLEEYLNSTEQTNSIGENKFNIKSYLYKGAEKIYAVQHPQSRKVSYDTIRDLIKNIKK